MPSASLNPRLRTPVLSTEPVAIALSETPGALPEKTPLAPLFPSEQVTTIPASAMAEAPTAVG